MSHGVMSGRMGHGMMGGGQTFANLARSMHSRPTLPCRSVKVKRLFFVYADKHAHAWHKHINRSQIETSPVVRGTMHPPELRAVTDGVAEAFGFVEMQVVSFEDLFGDKLHAAVDCQHPRDLFDVKLLYDNEGLSDALFRTFLIYVASSGRPPHELIKPSSPELEETFVKEFQGMTIEPVSLNEWKVERARLTNDLRVRLDDKAMRFLLNIHDTEPDFDAIGLPQAAALPAVRRKLFNLAKLKQQNPDKHMLQHREIENMLAQAARSGCELSESYGF